MIVIETTPVGTVHDCNAPVYEQVTTSLLPDATGALHEGGIAPAGDDPTRTAAGTTIPVISASEATSPGMCRPGRDARDNNQLRA